MKFVAALAVAACCLVTSAQGANVLWIVETGNYNTPSNWLGANVPSSAYNEVALINNGGAARLATAAADTPGGVSVATTFSSTGSLEILSGGSLYVTPAGSLAGEVRVGSSSGGGALRILPGASLTTPGVLASASNPTNRIELGGADDGAAVVAVGAASFAGTTLVYPNAQFTATPNPTPGATGAITLADSSVFAPTIASAGAALLSADGAITLAGKFRPTFSGFTPANGQSWDLLQGSSVSGTFDSLDLSSSPLPPGLALSIATTNPSPGVYRVNAKVVSLVSPDADFNNDGAVDADDVALWQAAFGTSPNADADNDADSDGADYLAWQQQFGSGPPVTAASTVPEPATVALLTLAAVSLPVDCLRRLSSWPC